MWNVHPESMIHSSLGYCTLSMSANGSTKMLDTAFKDRTSYSVGLCSSS